MARVCLTCPLCRQARAKGEGLAYSLVSKVEREVCPFCRAYERVYGRKAHASLSPPR